MPLGPGQFRGCVEGVSASFQVLSMARLIAASVDVVFLSKLAHRGMSIALAGLLRPQIAAVDFRSTVASRVLCDLLGRSLVGNGRRPFRRPGNCRLGSNISFDTATTSLTPVFDFVDGGIWGGWAAVVETDDWSRYWLDSPVSVSRGGVVRSRPV